MNGSLPLDYEMCGDEEASRLTFEESIRLLNKTTTGDMTDNPYSLLNLTNGKFLIDNLNNIQNIKVKFYLTDAKAKALADYYNRTISSLRLASNSPELSYFRARFSRDGLIDALAVLRHYTFNNITMQGFNQLYNDRKGNYTCRDYFIDFQGRSLPEKICTDPIITLDNYGGIIIWVIAKYRNFQNDSIDFPAFEFLKQRLKLTDKELDSLIENSQFSKTLAEIQDDFKNFFGCFEAPCDRKFLSERQYYQSSITNLNGNNKYPNLKVKSVAEFEGNKLLLNNKIPEIYGFYQKHFKYEGKIFGGEQDKVFNNNVGSLASPGSITNYFQFFLMYQFSKYNRTSDLAHSFNIWSPAQFFASYGDHLLFEWYLNGLIGQVNLSTILTGMNDPTLLKIVMSVN